MINGPSVAEAAETFGEAGAEFWVRTGVHNLADARNYVLERVDEQYVLFADDDIRLTACALAGIRAACEAGFTLVGARLLAPAWVHAGRWFFFTGQYHYLGLHRPDDPAPPIWGACMAVRRLFLADLRLRFRTELGRSGGRLQSGDDSSLVREVIGHGGRAVIPAGVAVHHEISAERSSIVYLLRRAFWQGRSEVRRHSAQGGFGKEWRRNFQSSPAPCRTCLLGVIYTAAVAFGILFEAVTRPVEGVLCKK